MHHSISSRRTFGKPNGPITSDQQHHENCDVLGWIGNQPLCSGKTLWNLDSITSKCMLWPARRDWPLRMAENWKFTLFKQFARHAHLISPGLFLLAVLYYLQVGDLYHLVKIFIALAHDAAALMKLGYASINSALIIAELNYVSLISGHGCVR